MHTIAHIDKDVRSTYFSDIQQQIFDRFYKVIHRDDEGKLYLGDSADDAPHERTLSLLISPGMKVVGDQRVRKANFFGALRVAD